MMRKTCPCPNWVDNLRRQQAIRTAGTMVRLLWLCWDHMLIHLLNRLLWLQHPEANGEYDSEDDTPLCAMFGPGPKTDPSSEVPQAPMMPPPLVTTHVDSKVSVTLAKSGTPDKRYIRCTRRQTNVRPKHPRAAVSVPSSTRTRSKANGKSTVRADKKRPMI